MKIFLAPLSLLLLISGTAQANKITFNTKAAAKVDILIVMDNSGSMQSNQDRIANAAGAFFTKLRHSTIDYHIGVVTTDSYNTGWRYSLRLRDGSGNNRSGVYVITPETPNQDVVFRTNISQGIGGFAEESGINSMIEVLGFAENADFRRPDANLAVLVISDEDDNPRKVTPIKDAQTFLEKNHGSFSTIAVLDRQCAVNTPVVQIGERYMQLTDLTGGYKGSICDAENAMILFADYLNQITPLPPEYRIQLSHDVIEATIAVRINGRLIAKDPTDGWTYEAATKEVILHGSAVPQKGDRVSVTFDYQE